MYTQTYDCKAGEVSVTKTNGNVPVRANCIRHDGAKWYVKNAMGISIDDLHEALDFCGGESYPNQHNPMA